MKDSTIGYRKNNNKVFDGGRVACAHGNLCRDYMKNGASILSVYCPYECDHYLPITSIPDNIRGLVYGQ